MILVSQAMSSQWLLRTNCGLEISMSFITIALVFARNMRPSTHSRKNTTSVLVQRSIAFIPRSKRLVSSLIILDFPYFRQSFTRGAEEPEIQAC